MLGHRRRDGLVSNVTRPPTGLAGCCHQGGQPVNQSTSAATIRICARHRPTFDAEIATLVAWSALVRRAATPRDPASGHHLCAATDDLLSSDRTGSTSVLARCPFGLLRPRSLTRRDPEWKSHGPIRRAPGHGRRRHGHDDLWPRCSLPFEILPWV